MTFLKQIDITLIPCILGPIPLKRYAYSCMYCCEYHVKSNAQMLLSFEEIHKNITKKRGQR